MRERHPWVAASRRQRDDHQIGLVPFLRVQLQFPGTEHDLAEAMPHEVWLQREREVENDALVSPARCRRHEQLAVHQLVARREPRSLVHETIDLRSSPSMRTDRWHGHNLLGARIEAQLGTDDDRA